MAKSLPALDYHGYDAIAKILEALRKSPLSQEEVDEEMANLNWLREQEGIAKVRYYQGKDDFLAFIWKKIPLVEKHGDSFSLSSIGAELSRYLGTEKYNQHFFDLAREYSQEKFSYFDDFLSYLQRFVGQGRTTISKTEIRDLFRQVLGGNDYSRRAILELLTGFGVLGLRDDEYHIDLELLSRADSSLIEKAILQRIKVLYDNEITHYDEIADLLQSEFPQINVPDLLDKLVKEHKVAVLETRGVRGKYVISVTAD